MQELFDSLSNYKPKQFDARYYIKIQGKEIVCLANSEGPDTAEIDKDTYVFLTRQGHQNFYYEKGNIIRKPPVNVKRKYSVLARSAHGTHFIDGDPYWPINTGEGGHEWQTPSE